MNNIEVYPFDYIETGLNIFYSLHEENKKGCYNDKFETFNHVLVNQLYSKCVFLFNYNKNGQECKFEDLKFPHRDQSVLSSMFRDIIEIYFNEFDCSTFVQNNLCFN